MNKFLILAFTLTVASTGINAQNRDNKKEDIKEYYNGDDFNFDNFESDKELNLSSNQIKKLKEVNRGIGLKFAEIGKDPTLSGYEKGVRKRELALQRKQEVYKILNKDQKTKWEGKYNHHDHSYKRDNIKDNLKDRIEDQIDALEDRYDSEKKSIEKNNYLSKEQKKAQKKMLESKFKSEKALLKSKKENIKNNPLLRGE